MSWRDVREAGRGSGGVEAGTSTFEQGAGVISTGAGLAGQAAKTTDATLKTMDAAYAFDNASDEQVRRAAEQWLESHGDSPLAMEIRSALAAGGDEGLRQAIRDAGLIGELSGYWENALGAGVAIASLAASD